MKLQNNMNESKILQEIIPNFKTSLVDIDIKEYDIIDTHIHGRSLFNLFGYRIPESDNSPESIVNKLSKLGINGVVLEHYFENITKDGYNPLRVPLKAEKEAKRKGIKVYPGLEVEFNKKQLQEDFWQGIDKLELVFFPWSENINIQNKSALEVLDYCKDNNIVTIEPHPDRIVLGDYNPVSHIRDLMKEVHGVEIINGGHPLVSIKSSAIMYYLNSKELNNNIASTVGGSDAHTIKDIGNAYTLFPKGEDFLELLRKRSKKIKSGGEGTEDIKEGVNWYLNTQRLVKRAINVKKGKLEPVSQFEEIYKNSKHSVLVAKLVSNGMISLFVALGGAKFIYNRSLKLANEHYNNILRKLN